MITKDTMLSELLSDDSDALRHENPNHDPKTGQFTSGNAAKAVSAAQTAVKGVDTTVGSVSSIRGRPTYPYHYTKMDDQELQNRINRLSKEHQYSDLVGDTRYVKSGADRAREVLQTIGATLGVAVAGLTIYNLAKGNKQPGKK